MTQSVRLLRRVSGPTGHFIDRRGSPISVGARLLPIKPLAALVGHHHRPTIGFACRKGSYVQIPVRSTHHHVQPNISQSKIAPRDLVCDRCWNDLFNTEIYENCCTAHTSERNWSRVHVEATATVAEIQAACCSWCAYIREFIKDSWAPDYRVTISLYPSEFKSVTPKGSNTFWLGIDCKSPAGEWKGGYSLFLHACTPADDPASKYVTARPLRIDVDSELAKAQIREWFEDCKTHTPCSSLPHETFLPARVMEVSPPGRHSPRILESKGRKGVYATLSYPRGKTDFPMLTKSNHAQLTTALDMDALPATIRDAIATARTLSIPYLWVDALCILQDVEKEKIRGAANMSNIFGSSALTIVAAAAEDVHQSLIHPRVHNEPLHTIPVRLGPDSFGTMSVNEADAATYEDLSEPIFKSPGVVQEQALSNRILTYTKNTMMWRCNKGTENFGGSLYFPHFLGNGYNDDNEKYSLNMYSLALTEDEARANKDKALSTWLRLATASSFAKTSLKGDRLNALAGIASRPSFSSALGPGYHAGMWEYNLARQLTWSTSTSHQTFTENDTFTFHRPKENCAPSWSWASVEGGMIDFDFYYEEEFDEPPEVLCDIISCSTEPADAEVNPFGETVCGQLDLQGPTRFAWFNPVTSNVLIIPDPVPSIGTDLCAKQSVTTFEEAFKNHKDEFMAAYPDEDIAEDPELFDGTDYRNVRGRCDETALQEPVLVLCVGITLVKGHYDGVSGLLLVKGPEIDDSGTFKRIGVFERGRTKDFETENRSTICIV